MSLYPLYGVVALAGIAVNAAIVLISAANDRLERGMSLLHATLYAARRRVIPILITSLTTVAGLFSLATGLGGKSLVWGPVATAIVWGLTFSTDSDPVGGAVAVSDLHGPERSRALNRAVSVTDRERRVGIDGSRLESIGASRCRRRLTGRREVRLPAVRGDMPARSPAQGCRVFPGGARRVERLADDQRRRPGPGSKRSPGISLRLPLTAIGGSVAEACAAAMKAPMRKARRPGSSRKVPSGKNPSVSPRASAALKLAGLGGAALEIEAFHEAGPDPPQQRARQRVSRQLLLGHEGDRPFDGVDQEQRVEVALVVCDQH